MVQTWRWQRQGRGYLKITFAAVPFGVSQEEYRALAQRGHCSCCYEVRELYPKMDYTSLLSILESDVLCIDVHKCLVAILSTSIFTIIGQLSILWCYVML